jgi:hypothetical protein
MSVASTAPPRRKSRWWLLLLVLPVVLVAALLGVWLSLGPDEPPGKRTQFVLPGGTSVSFKSGGLKLELAPALQADNLEAELGAMFGSIDQRLFIRREVSQHQIFVTANQPLRSSDLHFGLFDPAGHDISAGVLWPDVELRPNVKTDLIIGDFELGRAVKVILSKAGK